MPRGRTDSERSLSRREKTFDGGQRQVRGRPTTTPGAREPAVLGLVTKAADETYRLKSRTM